MGRFIKSRILLIIPMNYNFFLTIENITKTLKLLYLEGHILQICQSLFSLGRYRYLCWPLNLLSYIREMNESIKWLGSDDPSWQNRTPMVIGFRK